MTDPDAELLGTFREEAARRLDEIDATLVAIESDASSEPGATSGEVIGSLFRNVHTIKGSASMVGLDQLSEVAHATENILAVVRRTGVFPPSLADPLLRASTAMRAQVNGEDVPTATVTSELAATMAALSGDEPEEVTPVAVPAPRAASAAHSTVAGQRSVRVQPEKIDHLVDLVGEALQEGRRLAHALGPEAATREDITDPFGAGVRTLRELQATALELRTLPLATITGSMPRAIRDLARAAGKDVGLTVRGANTEFDRAILESLADPLTHLLRNAVAHGIEFPADRARAGKPQRGQVELRATPRGSQVEIVVADDGRGVRPEAAERARREGSLADVLAAPGYSTAARATELAGRGVGLDAVRGYAHSLGGSFEIRSEPGRGMEVILLLPLALAAKDVLLFERGGSVFGIPLSAVEEVITVAGLVTMRGRPSTIVRGRALPLTDIAAVYRTQAPPLGPRPPALIVAVSGREVAVACDALIGREEVTVKPLGPLLSAAQGYMGAAILGDDRIALLIEPARLVADCQQVLAPPGPAPEETTAPKVLVVEDSFTVRELQRGILETAGYRVVTARDGRDALRILARDKEIALVITDLDMPELDGLGLTRAIRAGQARASLPVVIVTSNGSEQEQLKGIEAGADAYMVKRNFSQHALLSTVERLVGQS